MITKTTLTTTTTTAKYAKHRWAELLMQRAVCMGGRWCCAKPCATSNECNLVWWLWPWCWWWSWCWWWIRGWSSATWRDDCDHDVGSCWIRGWSWWLLRPSKPGRDSNECNRVMMIIKGLLLIGANRKRKMGCSWCEDKQGVPKNVLIKQNHHQNWVLGG